jgi:hypothetical protein
MRITGACPGTAAQTLVGYDSPSVNSNIRETARAANSQRTSSVRSAGPSRWTEMKSRRADAYDRARWDYYNRGSGHNYDRGRRGDDHGSLIGYASSLRSAVEPWPASFRSLSIKRDENGYNASGEG